MIFKILGGTDLCNQQYEVTGGNFRASGGVHSGSSPSQLSFFLPFLPASQLDSNIVSRFSSAT